MTLFTDSDAISISMQACRRVVQYDGLFLVVLSGKTEVIPDAIVLILKGIGLVLFQVLTTHSF